ncbi:MAG TPA: chemotaxis protein CheA [Thermodesulfobacteriota bacterium]|nr:chemotaxis protein CheA [Thermodesulfobacteriota bacterium]
MKYENLSKLIDDIVSDFLLIDEGVIDVPTAGKFLNQLESIDKEAELQQVGLLKQVVGGVTVLLEKIILNSIDNEEGYNSFAKGINTIREISNSFEKIGDFTGDVEDFMDSIGAVVDADKEKEEVSAADADINTKKDKMEKEFEIQDESLLKDFINESFEYIGEIDVNILNLEQSPEDADYINAIFRPFHSIKGVASFLNLDEIRDLAHSLENLLDRARGGELAVTPALIDIILDGSDTLKTMIADLQEVLNGEKARPTKLDTSELQDRIANIDQQVDSEVVSGGKVKKTGDILVEDGVITEDVLEETLEVAQEPPRMKIGEALIEGGKATTKQVSQALRKQSRQITETTSIRVDVQKLDDLIDMIGELVITQAMIKQNPAISENTDRKLFTDVAQLSTITSELQRTSTSLRMITIKQSFQRMARLVRDLSRNAGKKIAVDLLGEETEIDRNMVDEIYNPLVHMVRNSVDHGIEAPSERIKLGKPEQGLIQLKAYHKGGNVIIEISDDGRGLKKEKIVNKAVDKGLIKNSDDMTEQEIYKLLFLPGFSTAEKITDVSGRGVGMDVVKQAVEKLRGRIEVHSKEGEGSTFRTFFPLTMAIIDGMIVTVGKERCIIPTTAIRQLLRPLVESYNNVVGRGEMLNVRGELLPLIRLYDLFSIEPKYRNPWESLIVVIESENKAKCLMVDEVIGKEEVVVKGLSDRFRDVRGIAGGAILGDGNVALILDTEGLFYISEN